MYVRHSTVARGTVLPCVPGAQQSVCHGNTSDSPVAAGLPLAAKEGVVCVSQTVSRVLLSLATLCEVCMLQPGCWGPSAQAPGMSEGSEVCGVRVLRSETGSFSTGSCA